MQLFLHWSPVAYWAPTDLGSFSFSIVSFCLFILFMGFSRQEYWSGFPFPSPVDHILSYINAYIWNLEKWCWWTWLQDRNRDTDVEKGPVDTGEGVVNQPLSMSSSLSSTPVAVQSSGFQPLNLLSQMPVSPAPQWEKSCCSVIQLCPTLCSPMDCSMPGFPVFHHLLEFGQTHVHCVSDVIQPTHLLSSPSPPAFNLAQHQGLS